MGIAGIEPDAVEPDTANIGYRTRTDDAGAADAATIGKIIAATSARRRQKDGQYQKYGPWTSWIICPYPCMVSENSRSPTLHNVSRFLGFVDWYRGHSWPATGPDLREDSGLIQ